MHGTEPRNRRAPDVSPLRSPQPVFAGHRIEASRLAAAFLLSARDRPLVTAFRSPATARRFRGNPFQGQSSWPATSLPASRLPLPVRPFCSATDPVRPGLRPLHRFWPVAASPASPADFASSLHSPSGLLHPSGSKRSAGFAARRPAFRIRPISVRSPQPFLFLVSRLRIIVPGPLRFRRLAVPQTSWNLPHYAPHTALGQSFFDAPAALFLKFFLPCFETVTAVCA